MAVCAALAFRRFREVLGSTRGKVGKVGSVRFRLE